MKFHEKLKRYVIEQGLAQDVLARDLAMNPSTLSRFLAGDADAVFVPENWARLQRVTSVSLRFWTQDELGYDRIEEYRI